MNTRLQLATLAVAAMATSLGQPMTAAACGAAGGACPHDAQTGDGDSCEGIDVYESGTWTYSTEWRICETVSGSTCSKFYDVSSSDDVQLGVGTVSSVDYLGACVDVSGTDVFYRLADTAGNLVAQSSMQGNAHICVGAGDDDVEVRRSPTTCSGASAFSAWDYGSGHVLAIRGQAGHDVLTGGNGKDALCGGSDNDVLDGRAGADTLDGWTGDDELEGGSSCDNLWGYDGDDRLQDPASSQLLFGEDDDDCVCGTTMDFFYCGTNGVDTGANDTACIHPSTGISYPFAECESYEGATACL